MFDALWESNQNFLVSSKFLPKSSGKTWPESRRSTTFILRPEWINTTVTVMIQKYRSELARGQGKSRVHCSYLAEKEQLQRQALQKLITLGGCIHIKFGIGPPRFWRPGHVQAWLGCQIKAFDLRITTWWEDFRKSGLDHRGRRQQVPVRPEPGHPQGLIFWESCFNSGC